MIPKRFQLCSVLMCCGTYHQVGAKGSDRFHGKGCCSTFQDDWVEFVKHVGSDGADPELLNPEGEI